MEASLYVATATQRNIEKQLVVVANNIANSNTVGFRAESIDFNSLISTTAKDPVHFPVVAGMRASYEQGALVETGNPYDVAISGDGWFAITTPAGTAYTRDGRLEVNPFGELQTLEGFPVLDSGEAPIQLDPSAGVPTIHPDGRIEQNGSQVASLGLFEITKENMTGRYTNTSFFTNVPATPIAPGTDTTITQRYVESSNVNAVKEMAHLMTITQAFESATALIGRADDTLSKSINELGGG